MKILIIVAGTNHPSNSAVLGDHFATALAHCGAEVETIRLQDLSIDHFTLACYGSGYQHEPDFLRMQEQMSACSGFVIVTPIWNYSVPAHLKNVLDRMGSFALDRETRGKGQLGGKPFYLLFTGGAPLPAWSGLMQMTTSHVREALRYFGATPAGTFFEPKCTVGRGQFGLVVDKRPETINAIKTEAARFASVVQRFADTGALPTEKKAFALFYTIAKSILQRL